MCVCVCVCSRIGLFTSGNGLREQACLWHVLKDRNGSVAQTDVQEDEGKVTLACSAKGAVEAAL